MFNSTDIQSVFSGKIAEQWEYKSQYINSIEGNDNMMIPMIKKYISPMMKILEVGCGTGKLLKQIDSLTSGIELTGVEMSSDMLQQIDTTIFQNPVQLINDSIENFVSSEVYDIIVMKQVLHHIVSRKEVLQKLADYLTPTGIIIIMTPNDGYQKFIIPFDSDGDLLGRIDDSMMFGYIADLPLHVEKILHVDTRATFNSLYEYFMFLYSIGSLQKIFNYKSEYEYALKLINVFRNLFSKEDVLSVDFNYSYIVLKRIEGNGLNQKGDSMSYYKEVKNAFDDWAATYEKDVVPKLDLRGYSYDELARIILSLYDKTLSEKPVLELGVGTGVLGERIKKFDPTVVVNGLDISPEMLKKAKEKAVYNTLYLGSADEYLYTEQYAFVYSAFMFHSVREQEILLSKIADSLVNGGIFALVDLIPNMKMLANDADFNAHSVQYEHGAPAMYKTCGEMMDLIEKSPFELIELKKLGISKDYNHYLFVLRKGV